MQRELPHARAERAQNQPPSRKLFSLDVPVSHPIGRRLLPPLAPALERALGLESLNQLYTRVTGREDSRSFLARVLDDLGVRYNVDEADLARIPRSGPLVVVANHPFGAIEGIVLAAVLQSVRPDTKLMANSLLKMIPEMRDVLLPVDPFGGERAAAENLRPLRQALRWLADGKVLAVFPAGTVSHLHLHNRRITDPKWSPTVARLIRRSRAAVLPVYFEGRNDNFFQLAGLIHPSLRTALLPRQLLKMRGRRIELRIGSAIPFRKLEMIGRDEDLTACIRRRTEILRHRNGVPATAEGGAPVTPAVQPIAQPVPDKLLQNEILHLPLECRLFDSGEYEVYYAHAQQIPLALQELGRLREITYRATGEGTGRPTDIDCYDAWYGHLFVWNRKAGHIVGAYRLGRTDRILAEHGIGGLYTESLFAFRRELLARLGPAMELGRSFIRLEYQRSYSPLMLLWKGIGRLIIDEPRYRILFGPVSISNDYRSVSKQLMVQFLQSNHGLPELERLVRARHPFRTGGIHELGNSSRRFADESDDVDDLVSGIEPDGKGVPVLLRQYLKLGARFLAYNIDPDFNNAVDALMVVDLARADRKVLDRYLGRAGAGSFLSHHGSIAGQPAIAACN